MFIRRTQTRSTPSGQTYFTHRLVRSHRLSGKVRQQTLLNLGRHFSIPRHDWPLLCRRLDEILSGQLPLIQEGSAPLEEEAQRMAERLLEGEADVTGTAGEASSEDLQTVAVDSVEVTRPRSVGVEQVGCWALEQLGLVELLAELGLNGPLRAAAVGAIVGRSGPSRLGTGHLGLARPAQRLGRVAGLRLSDPESDADVSGLRRPDETPPGHRGPPVHPGHGSVRSASRPSPCSI